VRIGLGEAGCAGSGFRSGRSLRKTLPGVVATPFDDARWVEHLGECGSPISQLVSAQLAGERPVGCGR
jgi:hypothetical protein